MTGSDRVSGSKESPDLKGEESPLSEGVPVRTFSETRGGAAASWQLGALAGVMVLTGWAYWPTLRALARVWDTDPNYSHGFVVPFFALGLAWIAYTRHNVLPVGEGVSGRTVVVGCLEIFVGFGLHLFSSFLGDRGLFFNVIALIFILLGILMVIGGRKANSTYGLPVLFLLFMAPLPALIYQPVALWMQNVASIVAVCLFDLVEIPAFRNGYLIDIPGPRDLEVGAACSGLRSLTAILALAVAIAYLSGRSGGYRIVLVLLAAPVAIIINCVRVFGTGLIIMYIGPEWATGDAHEREGMVMVGVAAALLALLAWLMAMLEDWYRGEFPSAGSADETPQPA